MIRLLFYVAVMPPACLALVLIGIAWLPVRALAVTSWRVFNAANGAEFRLREALRDFSRAIDRLELRIHRRGRARG